MPASTPGTLIFLTGPPGSGKTTTAMTWALHRARPTFVLDWDSVQSTLWAAVQVGRGCMPSDLAERYQLAADLMAVQANSITASGNDVIATGAWAPQPSPRWGDVWRGWADQDLIIVVLLPRLDVCLRRNAEDPSRQGDFAVPADYLRSSYEHEWEQWRANPRAEVFDNSDVSAKETVTALEALVSRR
jgi:predicted kinase